MQAPEPSPSVGFETISSALPDAKNYHRWILDLVSPQVAGKVLEVGVGYGQYTGELRTLCKQLVALDCDPRCLARLKEKIPSVGTAVGDLNDERLPSKLGEESFQTIVCLNVLEHIRDEAVCLRSFFRCLAPGGKLLVLVPAHDALYGPMDKMAGHFRRYSATGLRQALSSQGFRVLESRYFNPIGGLGWWVNARFGKPSHLSDPTVNRQILFFDRYLQPLSRRIDFLFQRFFGQSVWAIAERPRTGAPAIGGNR